MESNEETQGKFTIGDEKVQVNGRRKDESRTDDLSEIQRVHDVRGTSCARFSKVENCLTSTKDPAVQKATGKTAPVDVMAKLREMKNSM